MASRVPSRGHARRRRLGNVGLLVITIVLLILTLEVSLRLWPAEILGQAFATGVLNKYTTTPEGIYYYDPALQMRFMKRNFTTDMYWNGYRWHHETDAMGFRNARTRMRADVLLLGDSMIYGHGVNLDATVAVLLERFSRYSVVNLGTQGHCAFQEAYLVTEYVSKFKPRYVILFFFDNDIADLYTYLTDEEMSAFIRRQLAEIRYRPRTDRNTLIRDEAFHIFPLRLYVLRAFKMLKSILGNKKQHGKMVLVDALHDPNNENSLGWKYTKQAILYMDAITKAHQAQFVIVPLLKANKSYAEILKKFTAAHGVLFVDKAELDNWDSTNFLPGDGHFNGAGATRMAKIVAEYLRDRDVINR